jgi:hypothetical protein
VLLLTVCLLFGLLGGVSFSAEPDEPASQGRPITPPTVALDNLLTPPPRDAATAYWMRRTEEQDMAHADMADPEILNRIIWFSV